MKLRKIGFVLALISGPCLALVAVLGSLAPGIVENIYSRAIYPKIAATLAKYFPTWPFPVAEILIFLAIFWMVGVMLRGAGRLVWPSDDFPRSKFWARWAIWGRRALTTFSLAVAIFLAIWGLNYQRLSWAQNNGWTVKGGTVAALGSLADRLAESATRLRQGLGQDAQGRVKTLGGERWNSPILFGRVSFAYQQAGKRYALLRLQAPPAKALWFPSLFSALGIGGIFIPFTGEPLVNVGPRGPSVAFDAAHEMSHERGWAREDEANFLAYLVLAQSGKADLEYAADLMALMYVESALGREGALGQNFVQQSVSHLSPLVRHDWNDYSAYWQKFQGPVEKAAQAINDSYLKTQGQSDGIHSYGRMVDLLLTYGHL